MAVQKIKTSPGVLSWSLFRRVASEPSAQRPQFWTRLKWPSTNGSLQDSILLPTATKPSQRLLRWTINYISGQGRKRQKGAKMHYTLAPRGVHQNGTCAAAKTKTKDRMGMLAGWGRTTMSIRRRGRGVHEMDLNTSKRSVLPSRGQTKNLSRKIDCHFAPGFCFMGYSDPLKMWQCFVVQITWSHTIEGPLYEDTSGAQKLGSAHKKWV